jgi:hypothetical protein
MANTPTPGYNCRIDIWFSTTRRGQKIAHYWCHSAFRAIRLPLAAAELFIAQDQANLLPGHPWRP